MYDKLIEQLRSRASWIEFAIVAKPSKTDGNGDAILFRKAADAVEELSHAQIAPEKIIQTMWIPVTEQLPEVGKKVLVFAYGNDTLTARMQKRTENGYPVFECNGIFLEMAKLGRITHWMPLPQPPEDGE